MLATAGLVAFYRRQRLRAALLWSLAGLARSNGILMAGFFAYEMLRVLSRPWQVLGTEPLASLRKGPFVRS